MDDADLKLIVGSTSWSGWTSIRVTVGAETCPRSFDIGLTDVSPEESQSLVVNEGDACTVAIGTDKVITGYVDRVLDTLEADSHTLRIVGRGKCQDLVDCAAEWPSGQLVNGNVLQIAQKLAQPYGITVKARVDPGRVVPQFNLMLGETAWDVIERCARWAQLLVFEDEEGALVLDREGSERAASGFTQGQNVERASVVRSMDGRYSDYRAYRLALDMLQDLGEGSNLIGSAQDPNVKRHRVLDIIAEAGAQGQDVAKARAVWEAARAAGRGKRVELHADSWRDSAGKLWRPNTVAAVDLPRQKLPQQDLVIGQLDYVRDEKGTRAEFVMMPKGSFAPEPIDLEPVFPELQPK